MVTRTRWAAALVAAMHAVFMLGGKNAIMYQVEAAAAAPPDPLPDGYFASLHEGWRFDGLGQSKSGDAHPEWGAAGTPFARIDAEADYADGVGSPAGAGLPSARAVLETLYLRSGQPLYMAPRHPSNFSQVFPYYGLMLLHDLMDVTDSAGESFPIPCDGTLVDQQCSGAGGQQIVYSRISADTTTSNSSARLPINAATSFMDLDCLYGRTEEAAAELRDPSKPGKMLLDDAGLPLVRDGAWLIADQRQSKLLGLLALHIVLLREHNRRVDELVDMRDGGQLEGLPGGCEPAPCSAWGSDELYLAARMWTVAKFQHVGYSSVWFEYVLGMKPKIFSDPTTVVGDEYRALVPTSSIKTDGDDVNPSTDAFASLAFRWIWTMVGPVDRILLPRNSPAPSFDPLLVRESSSSMERQRALLADVGLDAVLRGIAWADAQASDSILVPDVTSFSIFDPVRDLQASRDLGIPSYNALREAMGLEPARDFANITSNAAAAAALEDLYGDVSLVEALPGALAEDHVFGSQLGPLLWTSIMRTLVRVHDGDKFWHGHANELTNVAGTSIEQLFQQNADGDLTEDLPGDAFIASWKGALAEPPAAGAADLEEGAYSLSWEVDREAQEITFTIEFSALSDDEGYLGLGIGTEMQGADMLFLDFFVDDDGVPSVEASDRTGPYHRLPQRDVEVDSSYSEDWIPLSTENADGNWVIAVKRGLVGNDPVDRDILVDGSKTSIIWSYNPVSRGLHHTKNGIVEIDFAGSSVNVVSETDQTSFFVFHGLVMMLSWGFFAPLALLVARYGKNYQYWLEIHSVLAVFVAEASIPVGVAAMVTSVQPFITKHARCGVALLLILCLQLASGYLRMLGIENKGKRWLGTNYGRFHQLNKHSHRWVGRATVGFGLYQVYLGLTVISPVNSRVGVAGFDDGGSYPGLILALPTGDFFSWMLRVGYWLCIGVLLGAIVYLEVRLWADTRTVKDALARKITLSTLTMEEFNDKVLAGEKLVIINDAVVCVAEYMEVHPGGSKILKDTIGTDVTAEVLGQRAISVGVFQQAHKHSAKAWAAIQNRIVAYVNTHDDFLSEGGLSADGRKVERDLSTSSHSRRSRAFGVEKMFFKFALRRKVLMQYCDADRPVYSVVLVPKDDDDGAIADALSIGLYHKFRTVTGGVVVQRSYTPVARVRLQTGEVGYQYYIRIYRDGLMGSKIRDMMVGDTLRVQGPFEIKNMRGKFRNLFLIAGGTGISPMLQLLRCHLHTRLRDEGRCSETGSQDTDLSSTIAAEASRVSLPSHLSGLEVLEWFQQDGDEGAWSPADNMTLIWEAASDMDAFAAAELQMLASTFPERLDAVTLVHEVKNGCQTPGTEDRNRMGSGGGIGSAIRRLSVRRLSDASIDDQPHPVKRWSLSSMGTEDPFEVAKSPRSGLACCSRAETSAVHDPANLLDRRSVWRDPDDVEQTCDTKEEYEREGLQDVAAGQGNEEGGLPPPTVSILTPPRHRRGSEAQRVVPLPAGMRRGGVSEEILAEKLQPLLKALKKSRAKPKSKRDLLGKGRSLMKASFKAASGLSQQQQSPEEQRALIPPSSGERAARAANKEDEGDEDDGVDLEGAHDIDVSQTVIMISGPPGFADHCESLLLRMGISRELMFFLD
jgi:hypothetical protein